MARPWGGNRLRSFKRLGACEGGTTYGESFELAAYPADPEARAHPSVVLLPDGSESLLSELLESHGAELLGEAVLDRYGPCFPVLPKLLDVRSLLSVQAHPPGHPELYVILEAEPGATLRLGFRDELDRGHFRARLERGLEAQRLLVGALSEEVDLRRVQAILGPALASTSPKLPELALSLRPWIRAGQEPAAIESHLERLAEIYRWALDQLNPVPMQAGDLVFNRQPDTSPLSAAVHALGNPEQKSVLMLEIRRPGPTFRAWDHVRLPPRDIHLEQTLEVVPGTETRSDDFRIHPDCRGRISRYVATPWFTVDHLRPEVGSALAMPASLGPHSLHVIRGSIRLLDAEQAPTLDLARGHTAFVPCCTPGYGVVGLAPDTEVVQVGLPLPD